MRSLILALYVATLVVIPRAAGADPARHTTGPCPDCLASLPAGDAPAPLLVVLHGDGETAHSVFDAWEPAAAKRGILVFAPTCPRSEGCSSQSWWKWNGDPSWLQHQVTDLGALRSIDPARMWIAGWSGGGTYLGWHTQDFERDYAALVIHGGGVRPASRSCPPRSAGVYFLGGDKNPLHDLAEQLHDFYAAVCPHEDLTWTVLRGVDHIGERRALATYREAILDWLSTHRRDPPAPAASGSGSAPAPQLVAPDPPPAPAPLPPAPAATSSCRCETAEAATTSPVVAALLTAALGAALRRRQGARRSTPLTR